MALLVRAFPLHKPIEDLEAFAAALRNEMKPEVSAFFRQFGVTHESWHLQEGLGGPWLIVVTRADDPKEAAPKYSGSTAEFDTWFKGQVRLLSGVDPDAQPLGPPTRQVYAWSDETRPGSNICG